MKNEIKKVIKVLLGSMMVLTLISSTVYAAQETSGNTSRAIPESQTTVELIGGQLQTDATCVSHVNNYISHITLGGWNIVENDCYASSESAYVRNNTSVFFTGNYYKGSFKGSLSAYHYY